MKNKFLCCLLLLATVFNFIPNVNAQSMEDALYIDYSNQWWVATKGYTGTHYVKTQEQMIRRRSDNKAVYCLQPHVRFIDNSNVTGIIDKNQMIDISSLSIEAIDRVNLLTYYGYGYTGHTSAEWYYVTQMMIWDVTQPGWIYPIADNDASLTPSNRYDAYYNEINDLINKHTNRPSFDRQTIDLRVGQTTTIHDNNNLLENFYTGVENEHYKAEVKGNDLIVTAKTAYDGEISLIAKENQNPPMIYIGAQQLVVSISDPDYHSTSIKLQSFIEGKFIKYYGSSEDGVYRTEKNAKFEIYNSDTNTLLATVKTNDDGLFTYEFGVGNYRIHQIDGEKGYRFIKDINFSVNNNSKKEEFILKNEITTGGLEFTKQDLTTGNPIPNTKIEIYHINDNGKRDLIFTGRTNSEGKITIKDLFVGKFVIVETEAEKGYKISDEEVYFEIKTDGEIVKASMTNEKIRGNLEFTKISSTGETLPNTLIEIYNNETNQLVFSGRTNSEGKINIGNLEYGNYYIIEKEAPEGYELSTEKMFFEIKDDNEVVKVTMINEKSIVEVPDTGMNDNHAIEVIGMILIILGMGGVLYAKRNK